MYRGATMPVMTGPFRIPTAPRFRWFRPRERISFATSERILDPIASRISDGPACAENMLANTSGRKRSAGADIGRVRARRMPSPDELTSRDMTFDALERQYGLREGRRGC